MILYRIGEIMHKNGSNIIFESQSVGYTGLMPEADRVEKGQKLKLYFYEIKNDYYQATYLFRDFKERLLFIDLVSLNGVGPRIAFNVLNLGYEKAAALIAAGDFDSLLETPYMNPRNARLIIAELQDKWRKMINPKEVSETIVSTNKINETKETLKMLGFKTKQIDLALTKLTSSNDVEAMVEEAIKIISAGTYESTVA
ncbi:Holliday junction branch migration protein RuvA [Mycoplasmopsis adleri]|uniref:Holliday junction branch migration protein RuvA n=1 Tax=Mycoplasmopsis adleri TaxID=51362 RepID=UPI0038738B17